MKKFTFLAMFLIAMVSMALAQTNMFVWMDGIKTTYPIALVDSVTFGDDDAPIGGIGTFSVSATKQVTFSSGNLQYHPANDEWRFAENQTDYIGEANSNISSTYNGWIDLFGWGTGDAPTKFSADYNDYQTFIDWGTNKIGNDAPNTWRTLSSDEWMYIFYNRPNAQLLFALGSVNGVNGTIILPDNWTTPAGVSFVASTTKGLRWLDLACYYTNSNDNNFSHNTYTFEQWSKMEQAGAVFFPACYCRWGKTVDEYSIGYHGYYWSSTGASKPAAECVYFSGSFLDPENGDRRDTGQSVRLVKDVNSTTPEPPVEPETEWITIYIDTVICEYDLPFNWHVGDHTMILCETAGTYTHEEIVEDENYIYHYIFTLELTVIPFSSDTIVVEAYDSYEWHGKVYTESGTYIYRNFCSIEVLELTIIDTPTPPEPPVEPEGPCSNIQELDWKNGLRLSDFSAKTWYKMYVGDVKGSNFEVRWINDEPCVATWTTAYLSECLNTTDWSEIEWESLVTITEILELNATCTVSSSFFDNHSQIGDYIYVYIGSKVLDCDSEPQDTIIYIDHPTEYATICEGDEFYWRGWQITEAGTHTNHETVKDDNYTYHHIYTLELTVIPFSSDTIVVEAYDSYEWHGKVYTESGVHKYEEWCYQEILHLTIIDTPTPSEPQDTTIYHPVDITICENDLPYIFTGRESVIELTEAGTYTYEEIVEEDNYIYHFIYTLELTVMAPMILVWPVEAYDSYEWHGVVYTESGVYTYEEWCYQEILHLTIIDTPTKPEGDNCENAIQVNWNDEITICGSTDTWYAIDISGIGERGEDITTTFRNNSAETATITNASYEGCGEGWQGELPLLEVYKREVKSGEERTIVYDFDQLLDFFVNLPDDVIYLHIKNDGGCVTAPALWFWLPATEDVVE